MVLFLDLPFIWSHRFCWVWLGLVKCSFFATRANRQTIKQMELVRGDYFRTLGPPGLHEMVGGMTYKALKGLIRPLRAL